MSTVGILGPDGKAWGKDQPSLGSRIITGHPMAQDMSLGLLFNVNMRRFLFKGSRD